MSTEDKKAKVEKTKLRTLEVESKDKIARDAFFFDLGMYTSILEIAAMLLFAIPLIGTMLSIGQFGQSLADLQTLSMWQSISPNQRWDMIMPLLLPWLVAFTTSVLFLIAGTFLVPHNKLTRFAAKAIVKQRTQPQRLLKRKSREYRNEADYLKEVGDFASQRVELIGETTNE